MFYFAYLSKEDQNILYKLENASTYLASNLMPIFHLTKQNQT
jgi:hypothetical protein